jgi:hypothetical protein
VRHALHVILGETVGALLQINPIEGVRAILDRWIKSGQPKIEKRGERVTDQRGKPARRSSITGEEKLPEALGLGPRGHG